MRKSQAMNKNCVKFHYSEVLNSCQAKQGKIN